MVRGLLTDELVAAARRRSRMPLASFSPEEMVAIANEELTAYLAPLVQSAAQDYFATDFDLPLATGLPAPLPYEASDTRSITFRVPQRALGGALREIVGIRDDGAVIDVPRIALDDLDRAMWGVLVKASSIAYVNRQDYQGAKALRVTVPVAPAALVPATSACRVTAVGTDTVEVAAIPVASPTIGGTDFTEYAARFPTSAPGALDIVKGSPGFETLALEQMGTLSGSTITFENGTPAGVEVGDFVCLAGESPVPQIPAALHVLLAQKVAVQFAMSLGEDASALEAELGRMEAGARSLLKNRVPGAPLPILPKNRLFDLTRRW